MNDSTAEDLGQIPIQPLVVRSMPLVSRDEMNLAEFPLTVLSTRASPNLKTLEFNDTIRGKSGELLKRHWVVTGADKFGLPTASDDEVLLGLLKLTVNSGFQQPKIFFTRYELLKILRWSTEGRSYQRLQNAFDRLSGVRVKATNAFFDNTSKNHSTRNFGVIDEYQITHAGESNAKPSFFVWSDVIFESFQAGFIKKLDLDFYLKLNSAVSKRLYRYLDKHFWYKSRLQISLFTLAHEKIGISRNYRYASSIRQQIDPAAEELMAAGFLSNCEYMGKGSATEVVFYAATRSPRSQRRAATSTEETSLRLVEPKVSELKNDSNFEKVTQLLLERGIKEQQLERLIGHRDQVELQRIVQIVEHFDYLMSSRSRLVNRSPVGFLYRAIEKPELFVLPGEEPQSRFNFETTPSKRKSANTPRNDQQDLEVAYLAERKIEVARLRSEVEPELLRKLTAEVEAALSNLRGTISEHRLVQSIEHGVEERLLRLFAFPDFTEWLGSKRSERQIQ
ncbi:MAG: replication initiator protein A [Bdellovibrionales bacterium]|nr:replication initiator protein A [Bdellovibrionales bacterium]